PSAPPQNGQLIRRFGAETGLLLVDLQVGVDVLEHWGGPTGRRNNPDAEARQAALVAAWRAGGLPGVFTTPASRRCATPPPPRAPRSPASNPGKARSWSPRTSTAGSSAPTSSWNYDERPWPGW